MTNQLHQLDYPDFPADYTPNVVEIRDEIGVLARIEKMKLVENNPRPVDFQPQIITWLFDGKESQNVAYAHTVNTVLINRIGNMVALNQLTQILEG